MNHKVLNHLEVGQYWERNAEAWTVLSRKGYDTYRDQVNTPAFLKMMPDVHGLNGLDVGCGEGHNTRLIRDLGARMTAVDIARNFVRYAHDAEAEKTSPIIYNAASAVQLPFRDCVFDFATAFMSLMDMSEQDIALKEIFRVLKPGGFLQFSISHPCFNKFGCQWSRDENGHKISIECKDYFQPPSAGEIEEFIFSAAPPKEKSRFQKFKIPRFDRTLSDWLNGIRDAGFKLDRFCEPFADDDIVRKFPNLADTQIIAYFLIVRCIRDD